MNHGGTETRSSEEHTLQLDSSIRSPIPSVPPCLRGESSDPSSDDNRPTTEALSITLPTPGIHITGMNSALQRPPAVTRTRDRS